MPQLPHRRQAPRHVVSPGSAPRGLAAVALCLLLPLAFPACAERTGELTVVLDSTASGSAQEVVLLPRDPAALLSRGRTAPSATGDTGVVARWRALADSAAFLDARFQRARDSVNRDALAMGGGDRRSPDYARRYDALRRRAVAAESLRAGRDALRRRADRLRPPGVVAPGGAARDGAPRDSLLALRDGERGSRTVALDRTRQATVALHPGPWWVAASPPNGVPAAFTRIDLRAGARDTVRLRR